MKKGNWFQTYTGIKFYPFDFAEDDIDINDIAHALSNICRYNGHSKRFYSVAEHSLYVSDYCFDHFSTTSALYGLLHDASEAYICDLVRPLKYEHEFIFYRDLEAKLQKAIYAKFGLDDSFTELTHRVKFADDIMLITEAQILMYDVSEWDQGGLIKPIVGFQFNEDYITNAEAEFKRKFYALISLHKQVLGFTEKIL